MSKKKLSIQKIEEELTRHIEEIEALFPVGISITLIGTDSSGAGREFVIGAESPANVISVLKRTAKRIAQEDREESKSRQL